jgi:hypothetical protein
MIVGARFVSRSDGAFAAYSASNPLGEVVG